MTDHDRIVHALSEWDRRQAKRDRYHNPRFLGIALVALRGAEEESPAIATRDLILRTLTGRCADFVLRSLGLETMTIQEGRR